ncbi:hypothetical protein BDZ89DRAFT_1069117 [Hymenopellis radicata]|nr:hypothetical protein BDZ89DRAFT_1069117 [Hymenopellis radicata]
MPVRCVMKRAEGVKQSRVDSTSSGQKTLLRNPGTRLIVPREKKTFSITTSEIPSRVLMQQLCEVKCSQGAFEAATRNENGGRLFVDLPNETRTVRRRSSKHSLQKREQPG